MSVTAAIIAALIAAGASGTLGNLGGITGKRRKTSFHQIGVERKQLNKDDRPQGFRGRGIEGRESKWHRPGTRSDIVRKMSSGETEQRNTNAQSALAQILQDQARGKGHNISDMKAQLAQSDSMQSQMAAQNGRGNAALNATKAQRSAADVNAQLAAQATESRVGEMDSRRRQYLNTAGQARAGDMRQQAVEQQIAQTNLEAALEADKRRLEKQKAGKEKKARFWKTITGAAGSSSAGSTMK